MKPIILTQEAKDNALEIFKKLLDSASGEADLKINITTETLLQEQGITKPVVYVSTTAYVKIMTLINTSNKELAWYGTAFRINNNYFIEDIRVYPQTVTASTVNADEAKCAKWFMELPDDVINNLRFQGHSHVNMTASPSGRDTNNWLQFANLLKEDEFYILCIGNKRGEFYWNIYDKAINVYFENKDITMVVVDEQGNSLTEWATDSIKKYIEEEQPKVKSNLPYTFVSSSNSKETTKNTVGLNNNVYTVKTINTAKNKSNDVYAEMLSYIPIDLRDDVDYEIESDIYFTYVVGLPGFRYSNLYDCYTCNGEDFRKANQPKKRSVGRPKKEAKDKKGKEMMQ